MKAALIFREVLPRVESLKVLLKASHAIPLTIFAESPLNLDVYFKTDPTDANKIQSILVYMDNTHLGTRSYEKGKRTDRFTKMSPVKKTQTDIEQLLVRAIEAAHDRISDMERKEESERSLTDLL